MILKLVLIGETGFGKSSLGNFILQMRNYFKTGAGGQSETTEIKEGTGIVENIEVVIVDTPGLNDTNEGDNEIMNKLIDYFQHDGNIDGIILVFNFTNIRVIKKCEELIENLTKCFGKEILQKRLKVVMTNGPEDFPDLDEEDISILNERKTSINQTLKSHIDSDVQIFVVNSKMTPAHKIKYYPEVAKMIRSFYDVKEKFGSIKKEQVKRNYECEEQKRKELESKYNSLDSKYNNLIDRYNSLSDELDDYRKEAEKYKKLLEKQDDIMNEMYETDKKLDKKKEEYEDLWFWEFSDKAANKELQNAYKEKKEDLKKKGIAKKKARDEGDIFVSKTDDDYNKEFDKEYKKFKDKKVEEAKKQEEEERKKKYEEAKKKAEEERKKMANELVNMWGV